jgi:hypothetical protein
MAREVADMGMWIQPSGTVEELSKSRQCVEAEVKAPFDRIVERGVVPLINESETVLQGAAWDALRLRLVTYELTLCTAFSKLCELLAIAYRSQHSLTNSLFSGPAFSDRWDLTTIAEQRYQLQSEMFREQSQLNQERYLSESFGFGNGMILRVLMSRRNEKIRKLRWAISLLDERKDKALAYDAQTAGLYDYAISLARQLSASAIQVKKALYDPATGTWQGISRACILDIQALAAGVADEIERIRRLAGTPFDDIGSYGGNQSDVRLQAAQLQATVRRYYPSMTEAEVVEFLNWYVAHGCAYMALTNTLFEQYIGREELFEARFGFPLYDEWGDFAFEQLVVDFFCSVGGRSIGGLNQENQERCWETYLTSRDMHVDVYETHLTAESWEEVSQDGYLIVSIRPVNLSREAGGRLWASPQWRKASGHAMTVTGMTEEGYLRVSSWGQVYYIDPNDPEFQKFGQYLYYVQVSYS